MKRFYFFLLFFSGYTFAATWSETNFAFLYGERFLDPIDLDKEINRSTLTWEHVSEWNYGDNFAFLDLYNINDGNNPNGNPPKLDGTRDFYFEWHPRFSGGKIFGWDYSDSRFIKDVGIDTQINVPPINGTAYLIGPYIDFKLGGNDFIQTNWDIRDTQDVYGFAYQLTCVYHFTLAENLTLAGFFDITTKEGKKDEQNGVVEPWIISQPQLLYHFGDLAVGTEWFYWENKFGVKGKTESSLQAMVRWVL